MLLMPRVMIYTSVRPARLTQALLPNTFLCYQSKLCVDSCLAAYNLENVVQIRIGGKLDKIFALFSICLLDVWNYKDNVPPVPKQQIFMYSLLVRPPVNPLPLVKPLLSINKEFIKVNNRVHRIHLAASDANEPNMDSKKAFSSDELT